MIEKLLRKAEKTNASGFMSLVPFRGVKRREPPVSEYSVGFPRIRRGLRGLSGPCNDNRLVNCLSPEYHSTLTMIIAEREIILLDAASRDGVCCLPAAGRQADA